MRVTEPLENLEPSYSANMAPLVVRARTLARRLKSELPDLNLRETNIAILVAQLAQLFDGKSWVENYRNFERGRGTRQQILKAIALSPVFALKVALAQKEIDLLSTSVELFNAFLASCMGVWRVQGLSRSPSEFFAQTSGWVEVIEPESLKSPFEIGQ